MKPALVIGGVVAIFGGAAYYFLGIYQPQQKLEKARAEIATWEANWSKTRECLLSSKPASAKWSEALAVHELEVGVKRGGECSKLVGHLTRPPGEDTGIEAIEAAWVELDKAATKFGGAYVSHVDPASNRTVDPLPEAIDAFAKARANLRAAAKLDEDSGAASGALPAATILPLEFAKERVTKLDDPIPMASGHGIVGFASTKNNAVQYALVAGRPPALMAVGRGVQRGTPDASWGVQVGAPDKVAIGKVDDAGALVSPSEVKIKGNPTILAVVGGIDDGLVALAVRDEGAKDAATVNNLVLIRAKAGAFTAAKPRPFTMAAFATEAAAGATAIAWEDGKGAHVMLVDRTNLEAPAIQLDQHLARMNAPMCLEDPTHGWLQVTDAVTRFARDGHVDLGYDEPTPSKRGSRLLGCSPSGGQLVGPSYRVCRPLGNEPTCFDAKLDLHDAGPPAAIVPDDVIVFEARANVLAARGEQKARFFNVPDGFRPKLALTDGVTIDVLGDTPDGLAIARVPAK